jgi:hypothetical protein
MHMKKLVLCCFLLILAGRASAQRSVNHNDPKDLKFYAVTLQPDGTTPSTVRFLCSQNCDKAACIRDVTALRRALAPYPTRLLGEWAYFLVMAEDWKELARSHGGDPISPAFTMLLGRATVLDRSLFSPTADRSVELTVWSGISFGQALIDVAVTHEMGHAICQDANELHANEYGKQLREGKTPACKQRWHGFVDGKAGMKLPSSPGK